MAELCQPIISHIGLCVSDLERSASFYCEVFGYRRRGQYAGGDATASLVGLDKPVNFTSLFLNSGSSLLELIRFDTPKSSSRDVPRPLNRLGFSHLAFRVEALAPICRLVERYGGSVLEDTLYIAEIMRVPQDYQY